MVILVDLLIIFIMVSSSPNEFSRVNCLVMIKTYDLHNKNKSKESKKKQQ